MQNNSISDVSPLKGLTNLVAVYLENNQVSDISPLSGLSNLEELLLSDNPVNSSETPGAIHKSDLDFEVNGTPFEVWVTE